MKILLVFTFVSFSIVSFSQTNKEMKLYMNNIYKLVDSLKYEKIDTIMIYENMCHGCIGNYRFVGYIFWQKFGLIYFCWVDSYSQRSKVIATYNIFNYYFKYDSLIKNEILDSTDYMSNYHYYKIKLFYNNDNYSTEIPEYYLVSNKFSYNVNYIYRVEYAICHVTE